MLHLNGIINHLLMAAERLLTGYRTGFQHKDTQKESRRLKTVIKISEELRGGTAKHLYIQTELFAEGFRNIPVVSQGDNNG